MSDKKKAPWRIIVGLISIAYIIFMWAKKDIAAIYGTMPKEEVLPLIVTTITVSVLKVGVIAGVVLLIKWLIRKK